MDSLTGTTYSGYLVLEEIGRGGMAVVYKAFDPRQRRYVALKVLPAYFLHDRQFLERFHREAHAAQTLRHPNIVQIYDAGEADGLPYLAMEYVDGGTLTDLLAHRRGPLDLPRAADIIRQVAAALDHAHSRQFVHRDVKPSNILLCSDGRVLLSDFGIAKLTGRRTLTDSGTVMGTPCYMSPEQAVGRRDVDGRADVYALGVILYQMLTGQVPFDADTPLAVLRAVVDDRPRRPVELNPSIPPGVEGVILQAMAKDRERRFQHAGEMAAALQAVLNHLQATTRGQVGPARQAPPGRRQTLAASAGKDQTRLGGLPAWIVVLGASLVALTLVFTLVIALGGQPASATSTVIAQVTSTLSILDGAMATQEPSAETPFLQEVSPTSAISTTTPTPTPSPAPSRTRTPTSTATRQPPLKPAPTLSKPDDGAKLTVETFLLSWTWTGMLGADEYYEVRVWLPGQQQHDGIAKTMDLSYPIHIPSVAAGLNKPDPKGTYNWAVVVVHVRGNRVDPVSKESTQRTFTYDPSTATAETPIPTSSSEPNVTPIIVTTEPTNQPPILTPRPTNEPPLTSPVSMPLGLPANVTMSAVCLPLYIQRVVQRDIKPAQKWPGNH